MRKPLKRNLSMMTILTQLGSNILTFILSLAILKVTHRALDFGLVIVASSVVSILSSFSIGKLVDRYPKKVMMVMSQVVSVIALLIFLVWLSIKGLDMVGVIALTVMLNLSDSILSTSLLASAHLLVDEDSLDDFNGLIQTINALSALVAPVIAGSLFTLFSVEQFLLLEVVLELASLYFIARLPQLKSVPVTEDLEEKPEFSLSSTAAYLKKDKGLQFFSIGMFFLNLVTGAISVGFPFIMTQYFNGHEVIIGLTSFLFSFGMILASVVYPAIHYQGAFYKPTLLAWLVFAMGLFGVGVSIFFFSGNFYVLAILLLMMTFIMGVAITVSRIPLLSHFQQRIPAQQQGRIVSLLDMFIELAVPISALLYGFLFDSVHLESIFMVSGLFLVVYIGLSFIKGKQILSTTLTK